MYPAELKKKDTPASITSSSYFNLRLSIKRDSKLRTSLNNNCEDFNFHFTNVPFLSSNRSYSLAYSVFISQLIRYTKLAPLMIVLFWERRDFHVGVSDRARERLKSSLRRFYGRYWDRHITLQPMKLLCLANDHW